MYWLRDPQGVMHYEYHYHRNYSTIYFDGDPTVWERYIIKCILPKGSAPGIWGLAEMELTDKALNGKTYNFVETLIFEPDDSETDYVLFSEIDENNLLDIELSSEVVSGYGFTYRVIHEDSGRKITGDVDATTGLVVYGGEGRIMLTSSAAKSVAVYSIDGKLLKVVAVPAGSITIPMPAGLYIVDRQKCVVR